MSERFKERFSYLSEHRNQHIELYEPKEIAPRTILIKEGEISKKIFLIEKGSVRIWYNNKGKDTTFQFFFENEGISTAESFKRNIPCLFSVETIEASVIYTFDSTDFDSQIAKLNKSSPGFLIQMMEISLERQYQYSQQFLSIIKDSPEERYLDLLKEKPFIMQRVPLHYIASYLGINTATLGKIRNKALKAANKI